jgi:phosphopantetheine--protein transferase-like protein
MARVEELKEIVSDLMKADAATMDESTRLSGLLASSMGRARLDAVLRGRLGVTNPGVYTVQTFGELCQLLCIEGTSRNGVAATVRRNTSASSNLSDNGVAVGVDIQAVVALPEEEDYWEGDFYRQHFTQQEIAYALLQPHPRESFAAAWCAKEALRKADNRWAGVDWKLTEIVHDAFGKPVLRSGDQAIACAVSLSHTSGFAVAVVAITEIPAPALQAIPTIAATVVQPTVEGSEKGFQLPLVVSVAALLVSLVAAAFSFFAIAK